LADVTGRKLSIQNHGGDVTIAITRDDLARMFPRPKKSGAPARNWDAYVATLVSTEAAALFNRYGVTDAHPRVRNFLAQCSPETGGLTVVRESGAYTAAGILNTFGAGRHSAAITPAEAKRLAGNGPALFERAYGKGNPRKANELGNTQPGDGWKFRGSWFLQTTGREKHETCAKKIGCTVDELLASPLLGLHAALIEWDEKGCNAYADRDDCVSIRKLINAGSLKVKTDRLNGLPEARSALADAKRIWPDGAPILVADPLSCRLGDRGQRVTDLQNRLTSAGYPCGPIDGHFGKLTERAVAAFQVAHGVSGTGIADASVWATLEAAKPVVVARADVTAADLKAAGSETVTITSRAKTVFKTLFGINAALAADDQTGLGIADAMIAQGEKVKGLASRSTDLVGSVPVMSPRLILAIVVAGGLFAVWRWFDVIEKRRVEDARSGAHLGR